MLSFRAKRGTCFPFGLQEPHGHHTPHKLYGPLCSALRTLTLVLCAFFALRSKAFAFPFGVQTCRRSASRTPAKLLSGTHKNLQRLVICPIYSVVKNHPRWFSPAHPLQQVWVMLTPESCKLQNASNPMFDANFIDAQHQADRPISEPLISRRTIRIHPALDLRDSFLMPQYHRRDRNRATHDNRHDRHQQSTQTQH